MSEGKNKNLRQQLAEIQLQLKAPKSQYNNFSKFYYRSCEDILEAVKPLLNGLVLVVTDDLVQIGDRYYVKAQAVLHDAEDTISVTAFAREQETKTGMDQSQITGAASSYARKYALNGLFLIDDNKDADTQDNTTTPARAVRTPVVPTAPRVPVTPKVPTTPKTPAEVFDGTVETGDVDAYRNESGEVARDAKGHTACVSCGAVVSKPVETFSHKKFGKVLCMRCQAKEGK